MHNVVEEHSQIPTTAHDLFTERCDMNIPVGYQLHIHSWENDGDASGTEILSGLTEEDVKFYLALLELFGSGGRGDGFGNGLDLDMVDVGKTVLEVYLEHPDVSKAVKKQFEWLKGVKCNVDEDEDAAVEFSDGLREVMGDLLGFPSTYEYDFRVFDGYEVYYFETPVKNVTSKFKAKAKKAK